MGRMEGGMERRREREWARERERPIHGGVLVSVTVCGLGGHVGFFLCFFFSSWTFTQGL